MAMWVVSAPTVPPGCPQTPHMREKSVDGVVRRRSGWRERPGLCLLVDRRWRGRRAKWLVGPMGRSRGRGASLRVIVVVIVVVVAQGVEVGAALPALRGASVGCVRFDAGLGGRLGGPYCGLGAHRARGVKPGSWLGAGLGGACREGRLGRTSSPTMVRVW